MCSLGLLQSSKHRHLSPSVTIEHVKPLVCEQPTILDASAQRPCLLQTRSLLRPNSSRLSRLSSFHRKRMTIFGPSVLVEPNVSYLRILDTNLAVDDKTEVSLTSGDRLQELGYQNRLSKSPIMNLCPAQCMVAAQFSGKKEPNKPLCNM